jgi:mRNA-degrading endonuclease RelE of RelBE toxin-antitoxin system
VVFIETSLFSRLLDEYLSDEEYGAFQASLMLRPEAGPIIKNSGGVRKIRWSLKGKGKSGGIRVIYYWAGSDDQIFLLTLYAKGEKEDLDAADLRKIVKLLAELEDD